VPCQPLAEPADAVVVALKSRTIPAKEAVSQSLQALHWLRAHGAAQIIFKYCATFDSTPAGNIGPALSATSIVGAFGARARASGHFGHCYRLRQILFRDDISTSLRGGHSDRRPASFRASLLPLDRPTDLIPTDQRVCVLTKNSRKRRNTPHTKSQGPAAPTTSNLG